MERRHLNYLPVLDRYELSVEVDAAHGLRDGLNLCDEEGLDLFYEGPALVVVGLVLEVGRVRELRLLHVVLALAHVAAVARGGPGVADLAPSDHVLQDARHHGD